MSKKPRSLPKSVKVGGRVVRISIVEEVDEVSSWGSFSLDRKEVRISEDAVRKGEFASTLRHELTHAALQISGVSFSDSMEEEAIVRCMDEIFFPAWDRIRKRIP
jgi:hypothetical protein